MTVPQKHPLPMQAPQNERSWRLFVVSAIPVVAASVYALIAYPEQRGLVWLFLYTIPSHMFVSPFPHEPVLFYYAKFYPTLSCALVSTAGALVAGMWDYWLFIPLVHHPRVRPRYVNSRIYQRSVNWFRKSPFWALTLLGLTPLPFYPVKFLALADGYPMHRYLTALLIGRLPRYYIIAYLGYWLKIPNWVLITAGAVLLAGFIFQNRGEFRRHRDND